MKKANEGLVEELASNRGRGALSRLRIRLEPKLVIWVAILKTKVGLNWLFAERMLARLWRHADDSERGTTFQRVYNFDLYCACHDFDSGQFEGGKERSPTAATKHDQIALAATCIAALPHHVLQGDGRTNCGEETRVRHSTNS